MPLPRPRPATGHDRHSSGAQTVRGPGPGVRSMTQFVREASSPRAGHPVRAASRNLPARRQSPSGDGTGGPDPRRADWLRAAREPGGADRGADPLGQRRTGPGALPRRAERLGPGYRAAPYQFPGACDVGGVHELVHHAAHRADAAAEQSPRPHPAGGPRRPPGRERDGPRVRRHDQGQPHRQQRGRRAGETDRPEVAEERLADRVVAGVAAVEERYQRSPAQNP